MWRQSFRWTSFRCFSTDHRSRDDSLRVVGVSGAVRETLDYGRDYKTAICRSEKLFSYHNTKSENIEDFEKRVVSKCTVGMVSGWIIET